jgi:beta-glucosidase/6-phospho-beta-glucosidase/beta-galactosidase
VDANGKIEPVKFCWGQSVASRQKEAPWIANGKAQIYARQGIDLV